MPRTEAIPKKKLDITNDATFFLSFPWDRRKDFISSNKENGHNVYSLHQRPIKLYAVRGNQNSPETERK